MKLLAFICLTIALSQSANAEWVNATLSAYCPCKVCCGKYAGGRTASGTIPTRYRTAANNRLPFGTKIHIPGYGTRIIEDRMSGQYGHRIDIYVGKGNHTLAKRFGIKKTRVFIERKKSSKIH